MLAPITSDCVQIGRSSDTLTGSLLDAAGAGQPGEAGVFGGGGAAHPRSAKSLTLQEELSLQREFAAGESAQSMINTAVPPPAHGDRARSRAQPAGVRATRVLPVYVLSLLGLDDECLIDHAELAVETGDMVIALQVLNPTLPPPQPPASDRLLHCLCVLRCSPMLSMRDVCSTTALHRSRTSPRAGLSKPSRSAVLPPFVRRPSTALSPAFDLLQANPTRAIIASLSTAVSNMLPPYQVCRRCLR